ncbi:MAG: 23S rRNA (adenine(2503)-C(2))-methyltransferase RlmN [Parcubacteria group bacterium]
MDIEKLEVFLQEHNQPKFRLKQVKKAIFQDGISSFSEITTLSKELREELAKKMEVLSFSVEKVLVSKDGKSAKALFKLQDGKFIEAVLISPLENTWSVCVSSQVGCPLGCEFCSTGQMGFVRNLTAEEITDQVLFWKNFLRNPSGFTTPPPRLRGTSPEYRRGGVLSNVVYMGMGEPFLNWKEVSRSLHDLIDPELFGFGARSISVSTAGIPEGILKMAEEFPQVNLALSLHFGRDEKRSEIMPINRQYNLEAVREALWKYFELSNRKVFLEYVMLSGINDSQKDAESLARFVKSIGKLQLLHINLIRYSATGSKFKPSSKEQTLKFKNYLLSQNLSVTIRKSLGEEIQGACGQLASH